MPPKVPLKFGLLKNCVARSISIAAVRGERYQDICGVSIVNRAHLIGSVSLADEKTRGSCIPAQTEDSN